MMTRSTSHTARYLWTAAALLVLLGVTVGFAHVPLGAAGPVVALLIAGAKAALVAIVFMHLSIARPVTRLFAVAGLFWLVILMALTLADVLTRS